MGFRPTPATPSSDGAKIGVHFSGSAAPPLDSPINGDGNLVFDALVTEESNPGTDLAQLSDGLGIKFLTTGLYLVEWSFNFGGTTGAAEWDEARITPVGGFGEVEDLEGKGPIDFVQMIWSDIVAVAQRCAFCYVAGGKELRLQTFVGGGQSFAGVGGWQHLRAVRMGT